MGMRLALCICAGLACAALAGCAQFDVGNLAGDSTAGRNNGTAGSTLARQFIIDQLKPISTGLNTGASDGQRGQQYNPQRSHFYKDASSQAYRQGFVQGYNQGFQQYSRSGNRRNGNVNGGWGNVLGGILGRP